MASSSCAKNSLRQAVKPKGARRCAAAQRASTAASGSTTLAHVAPTVCLAAQLLASLVPWASAAAALPCAALFALVLDASGSGRRRASSTSLATSATERPRRPGTPRLSSPYQAGQRWASSRRPRNFSSAALGHAANFSPPRAPRPAALPCSCSQATLHALLRAATIPVAPHCAARPPPAPVHAAAPSPLLALDAARKSSPAARRHRSTAGETGGDDGLATALSKRTAIDLGGEPACPLSSSNGPALALTKAPTKLVRADASKMLPDCTGVKVGGADKPLSKSMGPTPTPLRAPACA